MHASEQDWVLYAIGRYDMDQEDDRFSELELHAYLGPLFPGSVDRLSRHAVRWQTGPGLGQPQLHEPGEGADTPAWPLLHFAARLQSKAFRVPRRSGRLLSRHSLYPAL